MKKIIILLVAVLVCSCGNIGYLVSYSVCTPDDSIVEVEVTYIDGFNTITETVKTPWTHKTFCNQGDLIGITAFNGSTVIDTKVHFKKRDAWKSYGREIKQGEIVIKGVIHSL